MTFELILLEIWMGRDGKLPKPRELPRKRLWDGKELHRSCMREPGRIRSVIGAPEGRLGFGTFIGNTLWRHQGDWRSRSWDICGQVASADRWSELSSSLPLCQLTAFWLWTSYLNSLGSWSPVAEGYKVGLKHAHTWWKQMWSSCRVPGNSLLSLDVLQVIHMWRYTCLRTGKKAGLLDMMNKVKMSHLRVHCLVEKKNG